MSYSITSTATSASYSSNLWNKDGTKSTFTIQNQSLNPIYFEVDGTEATTTSRILEVGFSYTCPNDSIDNIAVISPGGNSVVCVWTD